MCVCVTSYRGGHTHHTGRSRVTSRVTSHRSHGEGPQLLLSDLGARIQAVSEPVAYQRTHRLRDGFAAEPVPMAAIDLSPDADVGQLMAQALVGLKEATDGLPLERAYGHTGFTTERGR